MLKPIIIKEGEKKELLDNLKNQNKIDHIFDHYSKQLEELFLVDNPSLRFDSDFDKKLSFYVLEKMKETEYIVGTWVYYPWNKSLVHILNENDLYRLRTNRNKNIIFEEEQNILLNKKIGFAGLSIGNTMLNTLVYSGIGNYIKIADYDILDTTNLNRVRAGLTDLYTKKHDISLKQVYDINPFLSVDCFSEKLTNDNLLSFLDNPKLDLIFEAIDDFAVKIKLRIFAKQNKIPVVMITNLADNILIDIERYDIENDVQIFNGLLDIDINEVLNNEITEESKKKYAIQFVGKENIPERALNSLPLINKTLVGRPQLMSSVTIGGGLSAYIARKIFLDTNLKSGRYKLKLDDLFNL